jgi:hypothetical protein
MNRCSKYLCRFPGGGTLIARIRNNEHPKNCVLFLPGVLLRKKSRSLAGKIKIQPSFVALQVLNFALI